MFLSTLAGKQFDYPVFPLDMEEKKQIEAGTDFWLGLIVLLRQTGGCRIFCWILYLCILRWIRCNGRCPQALLLLVRPVGQCLQL